jgi:tetratricopeptide (TPR) repeat protein
MRNVHALRAVLAAILVLLCACACAQTREQAAGQLAQRDAAVRRAAIARLGEIGVMADVKPLLAALRDDDEEARAEAERAIWRIWSRSGDAEVDALFQTGVEQMASGDLEAAIATFSRVIERAPQFAEGWNKRATVYFLAGDLRRSLADCDEVMKRNPDHFGALSGYALIYARLEYYERALDYSRRALSINPNLDGVRDNIEALERLIQQRRRQTI